MKRLPILLAGVLIAGLVTAGSAEAAPPGAAPGQGKITCFTDGVDGVCTLNSGGAKGTATLNTTAGGVAGVFIPGYNSSFYGVRLSQVKALSFNYTGLGAVDPHWSIPIDGVDGDFEADFFAFVSAGTCNNGTGLVDVIKDTTCTIYRGDDALASYPNWAAFVAAIGTNWWIGNGADYAFVIADSTPPDPSNVWTVGNLTLGKPGK